MFEARINDPQPHVDTLQLAALLGLMLVGGAFVYSATMSSASATTAAWYNQSWVRQIAWYVLGTVAAGAVCLLDYRSVARWAYAVYWLSILPLVAVLIPHIGTTHGWGAMRWIDLGVFQFQPSEFAKLSFILAQAHFLSRPVDELRVPMNFFKSLGLMMLPFLLIMKEPDLGSALVLLPTGLVMLYVAGAPRRYLVQFLCVVSVLAALFLVDVLFAPPNWQLFKLQDYQKRRLMVYFDLDYAPQSGVPKAERERLRKRQ